MFDKKLKKLTKFLIENKMTLATAESCTGGLLSSMFTDISGSSDFVKANFITYANEAKKEYLGVSSEILQEKGAVSKDCAYAMAQGLHKRTGCNIAICTTGIAGPTGGTPDKPVGLVFISVFYKDNIYVKDFRFPSFIPRRLMKYLFAQKAIDCAYKIIFSEI